MKKIVSLFVAIFATTALWASVQVDGIYYNLDGDSATVTSNNGYYSETPSYSGSVVIPASFNYSSKTYRVTSIDQYAFRNCSTLTAITIPTSIKSIGYRSFEGCSSLSTVFWNAIDCYSESPFSGTPVSNIIFGKEVRTIRSFLFNGLSQLTSVTIPENLKEIGFNAFGECPNLTTVIWNAKNCTNGMLYGSGAVFTYTYTKKPDGDREYIGSVVNFVFGSQVERIPAYLCAYQTKIQNISMPTNLKVIEQDAFRCCTNLENLVLTEKIDSIGRYAFEGCKSLTNITIPQSVRYLGMAFDDCTGLKTFTVKNPQTVCEYAFVLEGCTALETVSGPASLFNFPAESMGEADYLPYTIQNLTVTGGELEETGCIAITKNYKRLKKLDVSASTNTTLADEAFMGCYNLESLKLPSQLERVPYMAVAGCKFLKSIDIPASVVEIEPSAFEDCRSIQTITFGGAAKSPARMLTDATSALKKIGNWAFYNAHELQNLTIPEGVEEIGDAAFYGCTYLEDLKLPSTVREIGDNCFSLCSKMKKITITSMTPPTIYAKTFYDVNRAIPVYVLDDAVENYQKDPLWSEFDIRGGATSLNQLTDSPSDQFTKIIKDGQLIILRDGKTYNAQGGEL